MGFLYKVSFNSKVITITRVNKRSRQESSILLPLEAGVEYDIEKLIADAIEEEAFD